MGPPVTMTDLHISRVDLPKSIQPHDYSEASCPCGDEASELLLIIKDFQNDD